MDNLLENAGFEGGWTRDTHTGQEFGEIFTPEGWVSYWKEGMPVPHDDENDRGYARPEMHVINKEPPFLSPLRINEGQRSLKMFTFWKIHEAGIYQRVDGITPGAIVTANAVGHSWSSTDDSTSSTDAENMTLKIGIDPTGNTNPWAGSVVWGEAAEIYDHFDDIPELKVVAQGSAVTVFIQSGVLWPFKHCDVYLDSTSLTAGAPQTPPDGAEGDVGDSDMLRPRVDYERTYLLLPGGLSEAWFMACSKAWHVKGFTVGSSADDAGIGLKGYRRVLAINPELWPSDLRAFFNEHYPGIQYKHISVDSPEQLADYLGEFIGEPGNGGTPVDPPESPETDDLASHEGFRFARAKGTKLGIHGILPGSGVGALQELSAQGAPFSSMKAVAAVGWLRDIKAINPNIPTIGRYIDGAQGGNAEGPDLNGDLRAEAHHHMYGQLIPQWEKDRSYTDYWEIINEQDPPGIEGQLKLSAFMDHCMEIANKEGYKLALFSHSMGVPEWDEWRAVVDTGVFARAKAGGHVLSLHEYEYPMGSTYGTSLPGTPAWHSNRGTLATRYRWLYEDFLIPRNEVIPLYITEANIAHPVPQVTPDEWMANIAWYDERLREDWYVIGAQLFTLGSCGGWLNMEFEKCMNELKTHAVRVKDLPNGLLP